MRAIALQPPVGEELREIARAIEARARLGRKRMRHELLGGQRTPPEIAARQSVAPDEQFARDARRNRPQRSVEDVHVGVGDRTSDRHTRGIGIDAFTGRPDRRLGGPVEIPGLCPGSQLPGEIGRQRLTPAENSESRGRLPAGFNQEAPRRRCRLQNGRSRFRQLRSQCHAI